ELAGVLKDISGRADFLTDTAVINTVVDTSEYDLPEDAKRIDTVYIDGETVLERMSQDRYFTLTVGTDWPADVPSRFTLRHGKLVLWPEPNAVYDLTVDFSKYHPAVFTDILFGDEFNEAIYHGVLKSLYQGQFKRQLKLAEQTFDTDETLKFKFYEQFPQAKLHARAYKDEIAKLIGNLQANEDAVVVEYRDI
ncbi:MAG: phage adaptor protein, partial [Planctomycetota bacterium]